MDILDRYRNDTRTVGIRRLCEAKALLQINDRKNSTAQIDDTLDEVRRIGDTGDIGEIADLLHVQNADTIFLITQVECHVLVVLRRTALIHILCHLLFPPLLTAESSLRHRE